MSGEVVVIVYHIGVGSGVTYFGAFVRFQPHAHMQNALPRVESGQREAARFGISDTEFIRWPWCRIYALYLPERSHAVKGNADAECCRCPRLSQ